MAVEFVDKNTGEVIDTGTTPPRRTRKPKAERVERVNMTPVIIIAALAIGFLVGGGVGTSWQQDVDNNRGYAVDCNQ